MDDTRYQIVYDYPAALEAALEHIALSSGLRDKTRSLYLAVVAYFEKHGSMTNQALANVCKVAGCKKPADASNFFGKRLDAIVRPYGLSVRSEGKKHHLIQTMELEVTVVVETLRGPEIARFLLKLEQAGQWAKKTGVHVISAAPNQLGPAGVLFTLSVKKGDNLCFIDELLGLIDCAIPIGEEYKKQVYVHGVGRWRKTGA